MGCFHPQKLAEYQAGRLDGAARAAVEAHLDGCARCRTAHQRASGALEALREIADGALPTPSPASPARIEATLRWTRKTPRWNDERHPWRIVGGLAAAAACAAALAVWKPWHHPAPTVTPIAPPTVQEAIAPSPPPRAQSLSAVVTLLGGAAELSRAGAQARLDPSSLLAAGDALQTGADGRVGLQWGEGSGALVGPRSSLALRKLDPLAQELRLERGRVAVRVGPHQPGEALQVLTPSHAITVRGTWFIVAADARGTTVEVLEGVVEVAALDGDGSSTRVAAPQRAFFPRGTGVPVGARPLSGRDAATLRLVNEMGLLPAWASVERAAATTGLLDVGSTPTAQLVVDGVAFGSTPLMLRRTQGRHLVELSRPGFATISRWVTVGREPGALRLALLPESEPTEVVPPAQEEVQEVMKSRRRQIAACYEHSLKRDPNLSGTVTLQLKIGAAGQVLRSTVESDTVADAEVTSCLRREAAGWVFRGARNATIVYPFVFRTP